MEWFLERSRLVRVARGWRRRVLETLVDFGLLDALKLAEQQQDFSAAQQQQRRRRQFLQLELDPASRAGQPHPLDKVACQLMTPSALRDIRATPGVAETWPPIFGQPTCRNT